MKYYKTIQVLLILFAAIGITHVSVAQPFDKAPSVSKKKVKQIIEWVRPNLKQSSKEGLCSEFDRNGNLIAYHNRKEASKKKSTFKYDKNGKLLEKIERHDEHEWKAVYAYQKDRVVEEVKFRGKTTKTFYFKNKKGQLIEKKTFTKGLELGVQFVLKEQVFFYFNKKDSLKSEKIVRFNLIPGKRSRGHESRKILHSYSSKSGKRTKTIEYDFGGSVIKEVFFEYDTKKRLTKKLSHFKIENTINTIKYEYQKGQLWQIISERPGYKDVKIFVDSRLIRLRSYNEDQLFRVVDYQYDYY